MHYTITYFLLALVGVIFVDGTSLVSDKVLGSDLEGVISLHKSSFRGEKKREGYLQYASYELFAEEDKQQRNSLVITCADEGSKCQYYDVVEKTWKESRTNKIFFSDKGFFDMFEVLRIHIPNKFLLLLTMEKKDRLVSDHTFLVTYKIVQEFLREDVHNKIMDLKAIFVDDKTPDYLKPHSLFQSVVLLDSTLKTFGQSLTITSSTGFVDVDKILAIRQLEHHEYFLSFSRQEWELGNPDISITLDILKKDLTSMDPENKCQDSDFYVGFLEYKKNVCAEVRCRKKMYDVTFRGRFDEKEYDLVIKCPKEASSGRKGMCFLKSVPDESGMSINRKLNKKLSDNERVELVAEQRKLLIVATAKTPKMTFPIVHYFQLDDLFKTKLRAMEKMMEIGRGDNACWEVTLVMPSRVRRDFTVPLTFNCQRTVAIGGRGDLVVLDNASMQHLSVQKLTLNLETNEFESPSVQFQPGNPIAIRFVDKWQPEPIVRVLGKADVALHHIMEDLRELRQQYLEAVAKDPDAKKSLEMNRNVVLVMHGQTTVNDMIAVVIKAVIVCRHSTFLEVFFTGDKLVGYDTTIKRMRSLNLQQCLLVNKNLEGEDDSLVKGLSYVTEEGVVSYMKPYTSKILARCQWFDEDTVFRFVVHDSERWPVVEGLFHCSLYMYLIKGPFKLLSESGANNVLEDFFVFVHEEFLVTNTNAYGVRLLDGKKVDESLMGPQIQHDKSYKIALQVVSV